MTKGRALGLTLAGLVVLLAVFFWPAFSQQGVFFLGDTAHHYVPRLAYTGEAFRAFRIPLWNPRVALGQPHLADPAALALYPPAVVLFTILPAAVALNLMVLGHVLLAALGALVYARSLGISAAGALLAGVVFGFGGWILTHTEHLNVLVGGAFLPLFLERLERALAGASRRATLRDTVLTSLLTAAYLCGAHVQMALYTALGAAAYGAARLTFARREAAPALVLARRLPGVVGGALLGAALAAIQLVPMAEAIRASNRGAPLDSDVALAYSYPPEQIATLLLPNLYGGEPGFTAWGRGAFWETTLYAGVLGLVLAAFGAGRARTCPVARLLLFVFVLGLLLAMGGFTPLYPALARLPGLGLARFPVRFLFLAALGLAGLCARGWDELAHRPEAHRRRTPVLLAGAALVAAVSIVLNGLLLLRAPTALAVVEALLRRFHPGAEDEPEWWLHAVGQIAGLGGPSGVAFAFFSIAGLLFLAAWLRGRWPAALFLAGALALTTGDLWLFSRTLTKLRTTDPRLYREPSRNAVLLQGVPSRLYFFMTSDSEAYRRRIVLPMRQGRYANYETLLREGLRGTFPSLFGLAGLEATALSPPAQLELLRGLGGYQPFDLAGKGQERGELDARLLARLNGGYVTTLTPLDVPGLALVADGDVVKLYRNEGPLPRVFVASGFEIVAEPRERLARLVEGGVDPRRAILEESPGLLPGASAGGDAEFVRDLPEEVRVAAHMRGPGILVLSDAFDPGWRVEVDGAPRPLLRANHAVRGVALAAGDHELLFVYAPASFRLGASLSAAGALAIGALSIAARRRVP